MFRTLNRDELAVLRYLLIMLLPPADALRALLATRGEVLSGFGVHRGGGLVPAPECVSATWRSVHAYHINECTGVIMILFMNDWERVLRGMADISLVPQGTMKAKGDLAADALAAHAQFASSIGCIRQTCSDCPHAKLCEGMRLGIDSTFRYQSLRVSSRLAQIPDTTLALPFVAFPLTRERPVPNP